MTKVEIMPLPVERNGTTYHAVAGAIQSTGKTAGEALDALTAQMSDSQSDTLIILQHWKADQFFTADQQMRLELLMEQWRSARERGESLNPAEQSELDQLIALELDASTRRTATLLRELPQ